MKLMERQKTLRHSLSEGWERWKDRGTALLAKGKALLSRGRTLLAQGWDLLRRRGGDLLSRGRTLLAQGRDLLRRRGGDLLARGKDLLARGRARMGSLLDRCPLSPARLDRRSRHRLGGALLLCFPLLITFCCQLITLRSLGKTLVWLGGHLPAVLLTAGILLLMELGLLLAFGRPFWAALTSAVPAIALAVASTLKEIVNGAPLLLSDLSMAPRVGTLFGFLQPSMNWITSTLPVLLLLFLPLGGLWALYRGDALAPGRYRAVGCEMIAAVLALFLFTSPLQAFAAGEEGESQAGRNDRLGLLLGLYSAGVQSTMLEPGDYTEDNLNRILLDLEAQAEPAPQGGVRPSVVLLASESFFDVTRLPGLSFTRDPLLNFRALSRSWPSGTFLSNTYGGGTGNLEMELLTGIPSAFLGAGESLTTLPDPSVYARVPSLPRAFSQQGYRTVMVHTYDDSLYNRSVNLPLLGFDQLVYQDDFPEGSHEAGGYLSDHSLTQELIRRFEDRGEDPIFLYGLSMENHQPYHEGKFFGEPSYLGTESDLLDQEGVKVIDSLAHGLRDADAALGELLDYFSQQESPVIVVFLGDHLPGLYVSEEENLYTDMGYSTSSDTQDWGPEEMKRMHSTDFLVWNNYGAQLEVPDTLSASGLGAQLLGWAGAERPLYFQWVDRASEEVLLYRSRLFVAGDGTPYETPPQQAEETVAVWRNLVYDILYGQGYAAEKVTAPRE